ncbi:MAG: DUF4145 domain-containing protein [Chloroflexi bacterium]|nr:DUF4145 domain-containing protein [Chloroflexota bacterium]
MKYLLERGVKFSNWERCPCGNLSEMLCICEGVYDSREHDPEGEWFNSHYKVLRCRACEQILILRYTADLDFIDDSEISSHFVEYTREVLYAPTKQRHYSIPHTIADIVAQAEKVVPTSSRAGFILCRAALEQLCKEQAIPETKTNVKGEVEHLDLKKRLNLLLEKEKLSKDLREIMHGIREIGNIFAHDSQAYLPEKISQDEVEILIGLVDYVLNRLYVDKSRTQKAVNELNMLKDKLRLEPKETGASE